MEVMAPTSLSGDVPFHVVATWGFENRDAINKCLWDGCCSVIFVLEQKSGEEYVIARAVVKRENAEQFIHVVKKALKKMGADITRLKVMVYDPCKCQG